MSNGEFGGNYPRPPGFGPWDRRDVVMYGIAPTPEPMPTPPLPFTLPQITASCTACSDSRIQWGPTGAEPCPVCCEKLIAALAEKAAKEKADLDRDTSVWRSEARSILAMRREIDRLKAKCNRVLRKLQKVRAER